MADVLKGINHIHGKGMVHLDIKPANIFITSAGTLKIGDFGLSAFAPVVNNNLNRLMTTAKEIEHTWPQKYWPALQYHTRPISIGYLD